VSTPATIAVFTVFAVSVFVVGCRRVVVVVVVVVVAMAAGGGLLLCAVPADDALADRDGLVELAVVHLVHAVLPPVPHQSLEPMTPQDLRRQIRRPRLTTKSQFSQGSSRNS